MKTPYFLIREEILDKNIADFQTALKKYWPNSQLAYSVKTNSLPWVLEEMRRKGIMAEVVSEEEYQLAKKCSYSDEFILYNGPIKSNRSISDAFKSKAVVNIDSINEIEQIKTQKYSFLNNIGIRLNVDSAVFEENDVDYLEDGFRFGFSEENGEFKKAVDVIKNCNPSCKIGLHLHCNSITRSLSVYKKIAEYAVKIIDKYNLSPSFVDIGGGFFGGVEGKPTADDYISIITNVLSKSVDTKKTKLIIEPGSALIGSAVEFHTSVIDVKDTVRARIVTTDGSRVNIDPLWKKTRYMFSLNSEKARQKYPKQIICGYTCMDFDRIMILENHQELSVKDKIVYHRVGAYSVTFGGPFIRYFPDVYVEKRGNIEQIRSRISVDDYYSIQSNKMKL